MLVDDCEKSKYCQKADDRCIYCDGNSQYKEKKYVNNNDFSRYKTPSKKKKGMGTEEVARVNYNNYLAKRMPQSGGIDGFEGDLRTLRTLMECKEETVEKGGEKQITIKKKWHEKIESEARRHDKSPFLIYGFKEDGEFKPQLENVYFSTKYTYLLGLLHIMKHQDEKIEELKKENEKLREEIDNAD